MTETTSTRPNEPETVPTQKVVNNTVRSIWDSSRRVRPVLAVDILLILVFAITQPVFLHSDNLKNLLVGTSVLAILAVGQTFVLLSGAADLSVAAIATLAGYFLGRTLELGVPGILAIVLTLVFGAALGGVVNGLLVGKLRLSFLVVTLASMTAFTGVVNLWSNTESIFVDNSLVTTLTRSNFIGVPAPIWIMIIVVLVAAYIQNFTMYGRDIYAVGGNIAAARLSGVRTERVVIGVFAWAGLCAAIGGFVNVGQIGVASPSVDPTLPLMAIAAVLLGGASLAGGAGGVGGTILGVAFIGVLQNGLSLAGIPSFWQQILTGVILVIAVLGDRLSAGQFRIRRGTKTTVGIAK